MISVGHRTASHGSINPDQGEQHHCGLDSDQGVRRFRWHMEPESRSGIELLGVGGEPQPAHQDLDDGGTRGLVSGELLASVETEDRDVQTAITVDDL
jgi:hypothetical protein